MTKVLQPRRTRRSHLEADLSEARELITKQADAINQLLAYRDELLMALERIAGSRLTDMDTLHPDSCAHVAQEALASGASNHNRPARQGDNE